MEDVLEVCQRPYGDNEVLVRLDETSKQQSLPSATTGGEGDAPAAANAARSGGRVRLQYERNGVSNLFMLFAPLEGWRRVAVTDRRTKVDWACRIKQLADEDYPDKERIVLVMDNLNTHRAASLYEAFEPASAAHRRAAGDSLHAQARELAEPRIKYGAGYGGD